MEGDKTEEEENVSSLSPACGKPARQINRSSTDYTFGVVSILPWVQMDIARRNRKGERQKKKRSVLFCFIYFLTKFPFMREVIEISGRLFSRWERRWCCSASSYRPSLLCCPYLPVVITIIIGAELLLYLHAPWFLTTWQVNADADAQTLLGIKGSRVQIPPQMFVYDASVSWESGRYEKKQQSNETG